MKFAMVTTATQLQGAVCAAVARYGASPGAQTHTTSNRLRRAARNESQVRGQLFPVAQKIVDLRANKEVVGFEVLARLRTAFPYRRVVEPAAFISAYQAEGLLDTLLLSLLRQTLEKYQSRATPEHAQVFLHFNLCPSQMGSSLLASMIAMTDRYSMSRDRIVLEITEDERPRDLCGFAATVGSYRQAGFKMALDDVCTGHATMEDIRALPVDMIKIDMSWTRHLPTDPVLFARSASLIELAKSRQLMVVAEGVETSLQEERLLALGCPMAQGFRYGEPAELDDALAETS